MVWLEHDALFAWLDEHPRVAVDMLQVLAHRMRANNERISDQCSWMFPAGWRRPLIWPRGSANRRRGLKVPHDLTYRRMAQLVGSRVKQ